MIGTTDYDKIRQYGVRSFQREEGITIDRKRLWRRGRLGLAAVAALALLGVALVALVRLLPGGEPAGGGDAEAGMPREYEYALATASNGMELHVLRVQPSNVVPEAVRQNVTLTPYYGVNGGFFYESQLLSIAVVNDAPVNGEAGDFGSGDANAKYARSTLVWDGAADKLGVQRVSRADELRVTDRADYWAQGGIGMYLALGDEWADRAAAEHPPFPDDDRLRSAAAYDADGRLYLIVSATKGTLAAFRAAIVEQVGGGRLVDGIFLDGDGSSQLRSQEMKLQGDGRPVVQMLRLLR